MRPLVGITTYLTPAHWSYWELETALIPGDYVHSVEWAGGRPLLVPPAEEGVEETLGALDALVLTGGEDIDPGVYGDEPHPETFGVRPDRDRAELALLHGALARDMPVLGICRGGQLINIALGGDLHQHLPDVVGHEEHKHNPPGTFTDHDVAIEPDTRLARVFGAHAPVKSHHHQGIRRLGEGLVASARAEDNSVEAVESSERRFTVGVLWHPEAGEDMKLFQALVHEARAYRRERKETHWDGSTAGWP